MRAQAPRAGKRPAEEGQVAELRPAELDAEVHRLNELLGSSTKIRFAINRSSNNVYVEVVDKASNTVLRTIPASELAALAGKLSGGGILVDSKL